MPETNNPSLAFNLRYTFEFAITFFEVVFFIVLVVLGSLFIVRNDDSYVCDVDLEWYLIYVTVILGLYVVLIGMLLFFNNCLADSGYRPGRFYDYASHALLLVA